MPGDPGGHDDGLGGDPAAGPHVDEGGVQIDVGEPGVVQAAGQELGDALVDVGADPRDGGFGDARLVTQSMHQGVDLAGGDPVDPGLGDDGVEGLVDPAAGIEQGRVEGALAQFGQVEVDLAGRSLQGLGPGAVAPGRARGGALIAGRADLLGGLGVDQVLQAGLEHAPEDLVVGHVRIVQQFRDQG